MKTQPTKHRFKPGSLRGTGTARTVLLRMAVDEARAERIAELKDSRPDLTWRRIAEAVGVSERAAFEWKKTGGIDYENAKALAGVFDVDVDYIWRGPQDGDTPDLLEITARADQLDGVTAEFRQRVDDVEERLDRIEQLLASRLEHDQRMAALIDKQNQLLEDQSGVLDIIRALLGSEGSEPSLPDRLAQLVRDTALEAASRRSERS